MSRRYMPRKVYMSNVVKASGCRPLFQPRPRYWLRRLFAVFVMVIVFTCFFMALFIITEAVK